MKKVTRVLSSLPSEESHKMHARNHDLRDIMGLRIYSSTRVEVMYYALMPGQSTDFLAPYKPRPSYMRNNDVPEFFYILEGRGTVEDEDEIQKVGKDALIKRSKRSSYIICNTGKGFFKFLSVNALRTNLGALNSSELAEYKCKKCGYVYDPEEGERGTLMMYDTKDGKVEDLVGNALPGTSFEKLPDDWVCPHCMAKKDLFEKIN